MNLKKIIKISLGVAALTLVGCAQHVEHKKTWATPAIVHEYRHHNDDNSWIYWYIIWSNNNAYYYSTTTPVNNFTAIPFTRSADGKQLPEDVKEEIGKSEEVAQETLPEQEQSPALQAELEMDAQQDAMTNEGGTVPNPPSDVRVESEPESSSTESESSSSSSDSGSSGGDSGGSSD